MEHVETAMGMKLRSVKHGLIISFIMDFVLQDLLLLEEQEGSVNFKFGVIYAERGQITDDEMLSNGKLTN